MKHYIKAIKSYADFNGRASVSNFWMFTLMNIVFAVIAMTLDRLLGLTFTMNTLGYETDLGYGYMYTAYAIFTIIPGLSLFVRRLHDIGKKGSFLFIILIPIVGAIWLLVLSAKSGDPNSNQYGEPVHD